MREKVKRLPAIIPIVVYHGRDKWQISENFSGLFEGPAVLRPYWPNFRYELQDLSQLDESDIRGNLLLKATLLTMMRSFDPDLADHLVDIFRYVAELANRNMAVEFLQVVVVYISVAAKDMKAEQVSNAIDTAFREDGGVIMGGFVEELIEQGKREGLQEGQQALREATLNLLRLRFDAVSPAVTNRLGQITDLKVLGELINRAATAGSLAVFEQHLETL